MANEGSKRSRSIAGIDIGGTNVKIVVLDGSGRIVGRGVVPTYPARGPEPLLERVRNMLLFLAERPERIEGMGIGCAGLVDSRRRVVVSSPNLPGWEGVRLGALASRMLGIPVVVDNDATAAAYGEFVHGAGKGSRNFLCLTLGTGVGGGVVEEGRVVRGERNFAGEVGHITIAGDGPRCACGNRGCLEAFVGSKAIVERAREKMRAKKGKILGRKVGPSSRSLSPRLIAEAALAGDRVASEVLAETGRYLGIGIASLVNAFAPRVVAIGGGVSGAIDRMRPAMEKELEKRSYVASHLGVRVVATALGNDAASVGAATLMMEKL